MLRPACLFFCVAAGLVGQIAQFDVATLKLSPPPDSDLININLGRVVNGRLTLTNASLSDCLKFAYGIVADAQLAGPEWIRSKAVRFDVVAQAPPETPRDQILRMLQALLAERLKVAVHHEQREISYVALVQAKSGPKMRQAAANPIPVKDPQIPGRIVSNSMPVQGLALLLSRFERETVLDRTGLEGQFEIKLEWAPNQDAGAGPSLSTAVQEQLGLRLEPRKGPVDVLVVDQAERTPTDN